MNLLSGLLCALVAGVLAMYFTKNRNTVILLGAVAFLLGVIL